MTPPSNNDNRKIDLIIRYLNNDCDAQQVEELSQLLRVDTGAREELRQITMQALAISELTSTSACEAESSTHRTLASDHAAVTSRLKWTSYTLAGVVLGVVIAFGIVQFGLQGVQESRVGVRESDDNSTISESPHTRGSSPDEAPKIHELVRIVDLNGQILWKGTDGSVLRVGPSVTALAAGTIILETETSYLEIEFADGTRAMLKGVSELAISGERQKLLNLRVGNLVVEAVPQHIKWPLVVRTPNSENTVIGTRFELTVENGSTALAVDEGKVQLRRLRDGVTVNVGKSEVVFVDEDTTDQELRRSRFPSVPFRWSVSFDQMPSPTAWYGDWIPPDGGTPGLLRAVPRRVGENSDTGMEYHYRISSLSAAGPYVCVSPDSLVRLNFRTEQESSIELFVSLKQMNRDFGGNFVLTLDSSMSNATRSENGWQSVEIPIQKMRAISSKRSQIPKLAVLSFVYVSSLGKDIGLEISSIEILTPKTRYP